LRRHVCRHPGLRRLLERAGVGAHELRRDRAGNEVHLEVALVNRRIVGPPRVVALDLALLREDLARLVEYDAFPEALRAEALRSRRWPPLSPSDARSSSTNRPSRAGATPLSMSVSTSWTEYPSSRVTR